MVKARRLVRRGPAPARIVQLRDTVTLVPDAKVGRLTLVHRAANRGKKVYWTCRCECGTVCERQAGNLKSTPVPSCGCYTRELKRASATKHGMRDHPLYYAWKNMMNRCYRPETRSYHRYGGRGITVADEWHTFEGFAADMQATWAPNLTLERRDNNLGYFANNCKWATTTEQSRNKSTTRWVRTGDRVISLAQYAEEKGIPYKRLHERLTSGMSLQRAATPGVFK